MTDDVEKKIEDVKARIEAAKRSAELKKLEAEAAALEKAPTADDVAPEREARATEMTGIENLLDDPAVREAYEAHKSKEPVASSKEPVAGSIVQHVVIFRKENIAFAYADKRSRMSHASGGNLFLTTRTGEKAYEVVTDKGRQTFQTALMDECDLRTLSNILIECSLALAKAPKLPLGSDDNNAQSALRAAVNKLKGSAKTKDELAAAILQLLG